MSDGRDIEARALFDLPPEECGYDAARVVVVPCAYEGTVSYVAGTAGGPAAIIEATSQLELYDAELGVVTHERVPLACVAAPDLPIADGPEAVSAAIEAEVARHLAKGKRVLCLGGEHSITIGAARAYATQDHHHPDNRSTTTLEATNTTTLEAVQGKHMQTVRSPISFLQIDAHLDLRAIYQGSSYSHACVGTHLAALGTIVPVGVRVAAKEEMRAIDTLDIKPMWGADIHRSQRLHSHDQQWIDAVSSRLSEQVYVTLDVDGVDPGVIPSTGTPVPGGISWYPLLQLLKTIGDRHNVIGCDLVELIPGHTPSTFAAAMLMKKMIGYFWG